MQGRPLRLRLFLCVRALLVIITVLAGPAIWALDPHRAVTQYGRRVWRSTDGLRNTSVTAILQARDGWLWLGTTGGLFRFDGLSFQPFDHGPNRPVVLAMAEDSEGALWFGTYDQGLGRLTRGTVRYWTEREGMPSRQVAAVHIDKAGTVWAGTAGGGLVHLRGDQVQVERVIDASSGHLVSALTDDGSGGLWIGTTQFAARRTANGIHRVPVHGSHRSPPVYSLMRDRDGQVWMASVGGGLYRCDGAGFVPVLEPGLPKAKNLVRLWQDQHGNLWVASHDAGLLRRGPAGWEQLTVTDGLPHELVLSIAEDREGSLWIGTGNGLLRMRDDRFVVFTKREGLPGNTVWSVGQDSAGRLWAGTSSGVAFLEGPYFRPLRSPATALAAGVRSLGAGANGDMYGGTWGAGLLQLKPDGSAAAQSAGGGEQIGPVLTARDGSIWIGTYRSGVMRRGHDGIERFGTDRGLPSTTVTSLCQTSSGEIWVGTASGIAILRGTRFVPVAGPSGTITALLQDNAGDLWATSFGGGLWHMADEQAEAVTTTDGLPDNSINSLITDGTGTFWMLARAGVFRIPRDALLKTLRTRTPLRDVQAFGVEDGLFVTEIISPGHPSAFRSRDGRLWFATQEGLAMLDPSRPDPQHAPAVRVTTVRVDGADVKVHDNLQLRPGSARLEIEYAGLSLRRPEALRYQVRLEGVDSDWLELGDRRVATYTTLPPGSYRFSVRAVNRGETGAPATLGFTQQPHFYQTGWFALLMLAVMSAAAVGVHRSRLRVAEQRFALVLAERTRVARELHDTLMQDFNGVVWHLEAVRQDLPEEARPARRELDRLLERLDGALSSARRAVWDLRTPANSNTGLNRELDAAARRTLEGTGISWVCTSAGTPCPLEAAVREHSLRIAQEALANVARHSGATRVELKVTYGSDALHVEIADDGRGFEPRPSGDSPPGHFGLTGMAERAREIRGSLTVVSDPGSGTRVCLQVPISSSPKVRRGSDEQHL